MSGNQCPWRVGTLHLSNLDDGIKTGGPAVVGYFTQPEAEPIREEKLQCQIIQKGWFEQWWWWNRGNLFFLENLFLPQEIRRVTPNPTFACWGLPLCGGGAMESDLSNWIELRDEHLSSYLTTKWFEFSISYVTVSHGWQGEGVAGREN